MPDVPFPPEPEPRDEVFADKLVKLRNKLDDAARITLTGDTTSRIRRPVLFILVGIGLWGAADWWLFSLVGLVALLALALTDHVVDLG